VCKRRRERGAPLAVLGRSVEGLLFPRADVRLEQTLTVGFRLTRDIRLDSSKGSACDSKRPLACRYCLSNLTYQLRPLQPQIGSQLASIFSTETGHIVFSEPGGIKPVINLYRYLTQRIRLISFTR
jgi:hypothetical protein